MQCEMKLIYQMVNSIYSSLPGVPITGCQGAAVATYYMHVKDKIAAYVCLEILIGLVVLDVNSYFFKYACLQTRDFG